MKFPWINTFIEASGIEMRLREILFAMETGANLRLIFYRALQGLRPGPERPEVPPLGRRCLLHVEPLLVKRPSVAAQANLDEPPAGGWCHSRNDESEVPA
jgi:hypothetical protein